MVLVSLLFCLSRHWLNVKVWLSDYFVLRFVLVLCLACWLMVAHWGFLFGL